MSFNTTNIIKEGIFELRGTSSYTSTRLPNDNTDKSYQLEFVLIGSYNASSSWYVTNDEEAKEAFVGWLENNYRGSTYDIEYNGIPLYEITVNHTEEADNRWRCTAKFQYLNEDSEEETPTGQQSITIGIQNIKWSSTTRASKAYQSIATLRGLYAPNLSSALNFNNKIGVIDGQTNGCDILVPDISGSISVIYTEWTQAYILSLLNNVGSTNSTAWGVFSAGSLLFTGAEINFSKKEVDDGQGGTEIIDVMELGISLKYRPYETIYPPSSWGTAATTYKNGWEYAWTHIRKEYISGAQVDYPVQINIEQVYPSVDFNNLFYLTWET